MKRAFWFDIAYDDKHIKSDELDQSVQDWVWQECEPNQSVYDLIRQECESDQSVYDLIRQECESNQSVYDLIRQECEPDQSAYDLIQQEHESEQLDYDEDYPYYYIDHIHGYMIEQGNLNKKQEPQAVSFTKKYHNRSRTENGAVGYRTTTKPLLDLNFKATCLRYSYEDEIVKEFVKAYYDSPKYAIKWLFFLRDIQEGLGERRSFKVCLKYLAVSHPDVARAVIKYVPEYGRYDDVLVLLDTSLAEDVSAMLKEQLDKDIQAMEAGEQISLLAKWMPSINTSSSTTKKYAEMLRKYFKMSPGEYRRTLSKLRAYSNVVEVKMSESAWSDIDYEMVPAKANLKYDKAFLNHDVKRRWDYLQKVLFGEGKLNAKGLMPYEIVRRYNVGRIGCYGLEENLLTELMWKKIVSEGFKNDWGFEDAIVVADTSGSMYGPIFGKHYRNALSNDLTALQVCMSLAIYFAEQLKGVFHNKAITFSAEPELIEFKDNTSLRDKLEIFNTCKGGFNTDIEAVFDLILDMAKCNEVPRDELPKQVLVISDMEFDMAKVDYDAKYNKRTKRNKKYKKNESKVIDSDEALFEVISKKYEAAGYRMPRLIFWNICGRTDTLPMVDNEEGLCLLSGFSQNAMKVAANREIKDPYEALIAVLDSPRYGKIEEAIKDVVASTFFTNNNEVSLKVR